MLVCKFIMFGDTKNFGFELDHHKVMLYLEGINLSLFMLLL